MRKKPFKDLSLGGKLWASILITVSLVVVGAAERDLQRRSPPEVNGNKVIWHLVCLNALGALSYFRWGRRRTPA